MGSVKDLKILEPAYENISGIGNFVFSDRYSIFDWGEMPDEIKKKGRALAVMGAFNFEELARRGIRTHYKGLVTSDGTLVHTSSLVGSNGLNIMVVDMAVVYRPTVRLFMGNDGNPQMNCDYSFFYNNKGSINNFLVPLEIIFRNGLPLGSSVFKRIEKAKQISDSAERATTLHNINVKLGLTDEPEPGCMLPKPVINYTTKLEASDRSLTETEAYNISGLTEKVFAKIPPLALRVNEFITEQAERTGIGPHWDGKVEMLFFDGLAIVDVVGTLDEDRFGAMVSKEFLRQWYGQNQPEFASACEEWSQTGEGWQERCPIKPDRLPEELSTLISEMYMAACNRYTERRIFDAPELEDVMRRLDGFMR